MTDLEIKFNYLVTLKEEFISNSKVLSKIESMGWELHEEACLAHNKIMANKIEDFVDECFEHAYTLRLEK